MVLINKICFWKCISVAKAGIQAAFDPDKEFKEVVK